MACIQQGFILLWSFGLLCIISNTVGTSYAQHQQSQQQTKRSSRITSSRSFGTNVKPSSSNGINFDCPEEFGYYPHPTDCTQYYVCVFGGALLESCTGGLMYSHELQTCDWPRNVGCEVVDHGQNQSAGGSARNQQQSQQQNQHVPSRVRFGAAFSSPSTTQPPQKPTVPQQYHRQPSQVIQAQVQTIPPPPELRVPPNPVITSRGQPKPLSLSSEEDIAKLYADAHDTLPPVEEEENDRQQRVYRGQPSTVSQVQRDRDGIIHQASINAIPNHGKIGSYAFGSQYRNKLIDLDLDNNRLDEIEKSDPDISHIEHRRVKRELVGLKTEVTHETETETVTENIQQRTELKSNTESESEAETHTETVNIPYTTPILLNQFQQHDIANKQNVAKIIIDTKDNNDHTESLIETEQAKTKFPTTEIEDTEAPMTISLQKLLNETDNDSLDEELELEDSTSESLNDNDSNTAKESDSAEDVEEDDNATAESVRAPRQLRPYNIRGRWPANNYRSIDPQPYQQQSFTFGAYNPYLTPPSNQNFNQLSPGYQQHSYSNLQQSYNQKPKVLYTGYNLSLPPPPPPPVASSSTSNDDFRPIAGNYFSIGGGGTTTTTSRPLNYPKQTELLPFLIQSLKDLKDQRKKLQAENFSYFHLENPPITSELPLPSVTTASDPPLLQYEYYHRQPPKQSPVPHKVTPNSHYAQFSTVGGFYNNQVDQNYQTGSGPEYKPTDGYNKLVSHYSISSNNKPEPTSTATTTTTTTESNYFKYNILANQKMKGYYTTPRPETSFKTSPNSQSVPPVTSSFSIVSTPNLSFNKAVTLQHVKYPDLTNFPAGITYAHNSTPESYQTFSTIFPTTKAPKITPTIEMPFSTTTKPQISMQFSLPQFVSTLQDSDLGNLNPTMMNMLKYFKQVGVSMQKFKPATKPTPLPIITTLGSKSFYDKTTERQYLTSTTKKPTTNLTFNNIFGVSTTTTQRPLKGYESFINSIPNQTRKPSNNQQTYKQNVNNQTPKPTRLTTTTTRTKTKTRATTKRPKTPFSTTSTEPTLTNGEYYDEYDYEEESEGNDSDDEIQPPSEMPPYMPMSETMSPPRAQIFSPITTTTTTNPLSNKPNYITGYFDATTTRRPFFGANFQQFYQQGGNNANNNQNSNAIPSFINFPSDIFQDLKQRLRPYQPELPYETSGTQQPTTTPVTALPTTTTTTLRTTARPTLTSTTPTATTLPSRTHPSTSTSTTTSNTVTSTTTTTPTTTTTATTLRTRYTIRPFRSRGQSKWQYDKATGAKTTYNNLNSNNNNNDYNNNKTDFSLHNFRKRPISSASTTSALGPSLQQTNANKNLDMDSAGHRVESSSPTSSQSDANIFVQPQRPTKVIIETIPSRSYYNTTSTTSNQGYQPKQQQQQQEHHQQQQQAQSQQSSYDSYYSVYDDDLDLYRDVEYQQQQQQPQPPRQQQQHQQPQQYQPQTVIRTQTQSTYRPLEILTTPASYVNKPLQQQPIQSNKQTYNNQQSLIYNTDYDEDLIAQIEQDNAYDQPTRTPTRHQQRLTLNSKLEQRPVAVVIASSSTTTARPPTVSLYNDPRNYYSTLTTESPRSTTRPLPTTPPTSLRSATQEAADDAAYVYETSAEYADTPVTDYYGTETPLPPPTYKKPTRYTTYAPKLVATQESDEYNVIVSTLPRDSTKKTTDETSENFIIPTSTKVQKINTTTLPPKPPTTSPREYEYVKTTTPTISTTKKTTQIVKTTAATTTTKSYRSQLPHLDEQYDEQEIEEIIINIGKHKSTRRTNHTILTKTNSNRNSPISSFDKTLSQIPNTKNSNANNQNDTFVLTLTANVDFSNRSSKKQHANKNHKTQQKSPPPQPSPQPLRTQPSITTSTPPPSVPSPNPTPNPSYITPTPPKSESLVSVVAQSQSLSSTLRIPVQTQTTYIVQQPTLQTQLQQRENLLGETDTETISDESQNIQVQTAELPKNRGYTVVEATTTSRSKYLTQAFGTSPRSNLVRTQTEKTLRGKITEPLYEDVYRAKSSSEKVNDFVEKAPIKFNEQQRKRIQSFVLSDVAPQSFKLPPTATSTKKVTPENNEKLDNSSHGVTSSTTHRYARNDGELPEPKPFKYSLQTGVNGFSLKVENHPYLESATIEDTPKPLFERRLPATSTTSTPAYSTTTTTTSTTPKPTTTTTTTTTTLAPTTSSTTTTTRKPYVAPTYRTPLEESANFHDGLLPTTYAPPLRNWRVRPTPQPYVQREVSALHEQSSREPPSTNINTVRSTTTTTAIPTTSSTSRPSTTTPATTERSVQTFTARAFTFKDNLSKTTGSPSQRFVSPYKSLENILQEKEERFGANAIRSTSKPRYLSAATTPLPYVHPSSKPFKSYFLITAAPRNASISDAILATMATNVRNSSNLADTILNTLASNTQVRQAVVPPTTTTTTTVKTTTTSTTESTSPSTISTVLVTSPIRISQNVKSRPLADFSFLEADSPRPRGRSRYTLATFGPSNVYDDEPTTYAPKFRFPTSSFDVTTASIKHANTYRRKLQRARVAALQQGQRGTATATPKPQHEKYQAYKAERQEHESKSLNRKPIENEATNERSQPRAEALIAFPFDKNPDNSIESTKPTSTTSTEHVVEITDRPLKYFFSNKYRQKATEDKLAESLQNAGYITSTGRVSSKYRAAANTVLEQLQQFLAGGDESDESSGSHFVNDLSGDREVHAAVEEIKNLYLASTTTTTTTTTTSTTPRPTTTTSTTTAIRSTSTTTTPPTVSYSSTRYYASAPNTQTSLSTTTQATTRSSYTTPTQQYFAKTPSPPSSTSNFYPSLYSSSTTKFQTPSPSPTPPTPTPTSTTASALQSPQRASRVNNAIKTSIAAAASSAGRTKATGLSSTSSQSVVAAAVKCSDSTSNAKCNEIPSRTNANANTNRNRGSSSYGNQDRDLPVAVTNSRGTHPPRTRPTLKPSGAIVSKAQEFVDIYRFPPTRPDPLYPQPTPDKTAAKCRKDVCLLPDCYCGGKEIPGGLNVTEIPQIVLITFDDAVSTLNIELYGELFNNETRRNPNGCPQRATFYVSHEWTNYGMVQDLYSVGHELASHTVSHSFGEQFSQKKWTREIAGQREILAAYGGVKLSDVRGMRAPFLSVGGNKMYKMLYDSNFTYDSSMPVYENRPPSWPYTLDYKIFHDCMIPPCPTRSYPGVWQVPMVMWQDLNGGRCSMGDACSNPGEADGVYKMIMKNFERHYTTNRAPFGLFYHAAWFTQPHHKEGFIKFLDAINSMSDVWIITNWQMLQWVRDPTPISRINSFQPFQCDYTDRPKRCNNPKVCNLWHKSGVRYMKTCQPCPDIYPWTGKTGIRSSRIDNDIEDSTA